ncbi:MAG: anthranilate synthase component I family protein [Desulfonatronovibrionaceae bacterium]
MIELKHFVRNIPADTQTPVSLYLSFIGNKKGLLLESSEVDGRLGRFSMLAWDFRLTLTCEQGLLRVGLKDERLAEIKEIDGLPFVQGVRRAMQAINIHPPEQGAAPPAITRSLCGYFGYTAAGLFEPALNGVLPPEEAEAQLVLPGRILLYDHLHKSCIYLTLDEDGFLPRGGCSAGGKSTGTGEVHSYPPKKEFKSRVREVKKQIEEGEAIQVVLSTRFTAAFKGDPFQVYRRLRQINPSPYTFFMDLPGRCLFGSSPELLVKAEDGQAMLRPIAGTRPRSEDPEKDEALARELAADEKEKAEHVMLVDLGRNDLGRIAAPGSVRVDKFMQIERFSHVMHMTSYLQAELKKGVDCMDLVAASFPAGTVSGAPKIRAMEIIAEKEDLKRGPYAGCIGWFGLDRDTVQMDTGITIRSLWVEGDKLHWQAGAGIVFDSDPEAEFRECQNKAAVIKAALIDNGGTDDFAHRQL